MNITQWKELKENDYNEFLHQYKSFFCLTNAWNCSECPNQEDGKYSNTPYPCGQYRCWCECSDGID